MYTTDDADKMEVKCPNCGATETTSQIWYDEKKNNEKHIVLEECRRKGESHERKNRKPECKHVMKHVEPTTRNVLSRPAISRRIERVSNISIVEMLT